MTHRVAKFAKVPPSYRYQKVGKTMISPLILQGNAFAVAQADYARWSKVPFVEDLLYYLQSGFVVARPNLFAMARPIERDGRRGWFIQYACGAIGELLSVLPCELEFIAWCRKGDENMRICDFALFAKKIGARYGYSGA